MKRKLKKEILILVILEITVTSICYILVQNPKLTDSDCTEMKKVAYEWRQLAGSSHLNTAKMKFGNYTCTITEKNKIKVISEKGYIICDFANDIEIVRPKNLKGQISFFVFLAIFYGWGLIVILNIK